MTVRGWVQHVQTKQVRPSSLWRSLHQIPVLWSKIPVASLRLHVHVSAVVAQTLQPVVLATTTAATSGIIPAPFTTPLATLMLPIPIPVSVPAPVPLAPVAPTSFPVTIPTLLLWTIRAVWTQLPRRPIVRRCITSLRGLCHVATTSATTQLLLALPLPTCPLTASAASPLPVPVLVLAPLPGAPPLILVATP